MSLYSDRKVTLSLQKFKLLSIELIKRVLSSNHFFPMRARTQLSSCLEALRTPSFLKNFVWVLFDIKINKEFRINVVLKKFNIVIKRSRLERRVNALKQIVSVKLRDEAFKDSKNSTESRLAVDWSCESVIVPYLL